MDWIPIDKYCPKYESIFLACDLINKCISLAKYHEENNKFSLMSIEGTPEDTQITHWMPLPDFPWDYEEV